MEQVRGEKEEAARKGIDWENKIRDYQEMIWRGERRMKEIKHHLDQIQQEMGDAKSELGEQQEILQWNQHEVALQMIDRGDHEKSGEIVKSLDSMKKLLAECKREIREYEELSRQYDELAAQMEKLQTEKTQDQQNLKAVQEDVVCCVDKWVTDIYEAEKKSSQWRPDSEILPKLEEKIREYQSAADAEMVQELLRTDYERQRQGLMDQKSSLEYQKKIQKEELEQEKEKLTCLQNSGELEPERDESIESSRKALEKAGIKAVPFYKTVEFSKNLDEMDCARLEAQLQKVGVLDALVVSTYDVENIRKQCPGFLDTILYVKGDGTSGFSKLTVSEELEPALKETVQRILSNIYEDTKDRQGIYLGKDGSFRQGILAGKAGKTGSAEFVGALARKRRKEQKIRELEGRISEITESIISLEKEITAVQEHLEKLQEEYQNLPGFAAHSRNLSEKLF